MPQQRKRKAQKTGRFLNILILIITVLIVFEGRLLINIFSKDTYKGEIDTQLSEVFSGDVFQKETETETESVVAGASTEPATEQGANTSITPDSPCVVPAQSTTIDDSYFSDAVFIGDSRVEGFHNQSGITQGTFLTGVGMDSANIFETPYITTATDGNITVFQALYNNSFKKMYIMLGTNELGYPDFEEFRTNYTKCLGELRKMIPNAVFYVMAVPYVEESKVESGEYVNNTNIDTVNQIILEICEANDYYYLNPNEVLSDGNGSLIPDATSDGIHMYPDYCVKWLDYLKSHYIPEAQVEEMTQTESTSESSSESSSESTTETTTESTVSE